MSSPDTPGLPPNEPPDDRVDPVADESSDFMSENSPEVRAMWAPNVRVVPMADLRTAPRPVIAPPAAAGEVTQDAHDLMAPAGVVAVPPTTMAPGETRAADRESRGTDSPGWTASRPAAAPAMPSVARTRYEPVSAAGSKGVAPARRWSVWQVVVLAVMLAIIAFAVGIPAYRARQASNARQVPLVPVSTDGSAMIVSRPTGAEVVINGVVRGVTPLKVTLPVGAYDLELRNGASKRSLTLTVDAATATREFVDLAPDGGFGRLEVSSDVPGARVTVDGIGRGVTPLTLTDIEPGQHRVSIGAGETVVNRDVTVTSGATAAVMASVVPSGSAGGWLTVTSPIELQVLEGGKVLGTTSADRLMLPAGRHELQLVAAPFEFQTSISAQIPVGRTITVPVAVPNGTISVNASPWADVFIDGQPVGSTPIANVPVPVGTHDIVWRHPQLGERRQTVRVPARTPVRVGIDLTK
jgi:hypothetical protein